MPILRYADVMLVLSCVVSNIVPELGNDLRPMPFGCTARLDSVVYSIAFCDGFKRKQKGKQPLFRGFETKPIWTRRHALTSCSLARNGQALGGAAGAGASNGLPGAWRWGFFTAASRESVFAIPLVGLARTCGWLRNPEIAAPFRDPGFW